jgi:dTDP-4-dehydrorhamnose 3,5-epimerase
VRISPCELSGVYVVDAEPIEDDRGLFARTFDAEEFAAAGLDLDVVQCSVSFNRSAGTLRGMHFQQAPHGEGKLVRCSRGRIFDVVVDVRPQSPSFTRWQAWDLVASSYRCLFLPPGTAHGFLTLAPESEVTYQMSVPYRADAAVGFRWDDPAVAIAWPGRPQVISARDRELPLLADVGYERSS